jgi:DNA gyrase subunit A
VDDYRKTHRGSKGVITIKTTERNGKVIGVRKVAASDELMVTSKQGKMIRIRVTDIRVTGRNAAGVRLMDMRNDDKITALQPIANEEEVENAKVTDEIIDENVTYNGEPEDEGSDETHESE